LKYFDEDLSTYASRSVVDSAIIGVSVPYAHMIDTKAQSQPQAQQQRGVSMVLSKKRQQSSMSSSMERNVWRDIIVPWRACALSNECMTASISHKPDQVRRNPRISIRRCGTQSV
jgi:hypothetical protein